jgi:hypothetical protein
MMENTTQTHTSVVSEAGSSPACGCSIVPPYILKRIADSAEVPEETRKAAKETLRISEDIRDQRHAKFNSLYDAAARRAQPAGPPSPKSRQVYDWKAPSQPARSEGQPPVPDRHVNEVYDGLGIVYDFFSTVFGRNSIDNAGSQLIGTVHYQDNLNNAFYDGKQVLFGDGDGVVFNSFARSRMIIAHELTHWLTASTAGLVYRDQSGALNESMSDVFACIIEHHHLERMADEGTWVIGDRLRPVGSRAAALRSLKAPGTAFNHDPVFGKDPQPWHMNDYNPTTSDAGGVHTNSGIPNHAFYLAATSIGGSSWDPAGRIWYSALTDSKISPNCTFVQFANLTVEHAASYGNRVCQAMIDAWVKVGVLAAGTPQPPLPPDTDAPVPPAPDDKTPPAPTDNRTPPHAAPPVFCRRCRTEDIGARIHILCSVCLGGDYNLCRNCYIDSPTCLNPSHTLQTRKYAPPSPGSSTWTLKVGKFCDYCDELIAAGGYSCTSCPLGFGESCANCVRRRTGCPHSRE